MIDQIKEHPIKVSMSILTLVSMFVGTVLAVDSRYAKAGDFERQQRYLEQSTLETKYAIDQLRKHNLIDKVFELELIPENKRTQVDKARLQKYRSDIRDIELKWAGKNVPQ